MKKLGLLFCSTVLISLIAGPAFALELFQPVEVEYSTYLGGTGGDAIGNSAGTGGGGCIAVDSALCAYVVGSTSSTDFPTVNAYQAVESNDDAFVAKLSGGGSSLIFSTYLGGTGHDGGDGIAIDSALNVYVTGSTGSYYNDNFPTVNAYQSTFGGGNDDAFVTKFDSTGSTLIYSTYLGGDTGPQPYEYGYGIAVDSMGCAYVTGYTSSDSFPTVNPYQPIYAGSGDVFVTKLDSTGSALVFSTYLGGADSSEHGVAIAVDDAPCAYITGVTSSEEFPTKNAYQPALDWNQDAFITKFDTAGSSLTFSTYLGGDHHDKGRGIVIDSGRNIYITGATLSDTFPTANAYQAARAGGYDGFVTKISSLGNTLLFSTYLGGSDNDDAWGIAVYLDAFPYVTGDTDSDDFPVRNSYQSTFANQTGGDAFVAKFCCKGQTLLFSTYFGGNNDDEGKGIAVDFQGSAYIGGTTQSDNLPIENPYQATRAGSTDGFITKFFQPSLSPVYQSGDYNGDGTSDIAIFRPSTGLWAIRDISRVYFGNSNDQVIPGDYNGDGTSDVGIFRKSAGLWAIQGVTRLYYGTSIDQPVPSDYDGDGSCDIGIFRDASGLWSIQGITRMYFGTDNDTPVPGDYNGDGMASVGIFRSQVGLWAIDGVTRVYFGRGNDQVSTGDYDGNGTDAVAIYRPGAGLWAILGLTRIYYGSCEDQAIQADYDGNGIDDPAIFRGWRGLWAIRDISRAYFGGLDDIAVTR